MPEEITLGHVYAELLVIKTRLDVWQNVVLPVSASFVGIVAGVILAVFALRG